MSQSLPLSIILEIGLSHAQITVVMEIITIQQTPTGVEEELVAVGL